MADTRKYEPTTGDPIGDAVRAALGETVRPNVPGGKPAASGDAAGSASAPAKPTIATIGAYTFTAVPAPKPAPIAHDEPDDEPDA